MKPFHSLTNQEILGLTTEQLTDSIRVGALERGIEIPITLPEALKASEWRGYQQPASAVRVYCPYFGTSYSDPNFGYLTQEAAETALNGAIPIVSSYQGGKSVPCIKEDIAGSIKVVCIGYSPAQDKAAAFKAAVEYSTEDFDKYKDECLERYAVVRQGDYDQKVRAEHRKEYLRLAGGNEEIAKAFYFKTGKGHWPNEDGSIN